MCFLGIYFLLKVAFPSNITHFIYFFIGLRTESSARHRGMEGFETEGVRGLKALGVRELAYKTAFLATTVVPTDYRVSLNFSVLLLPICAYKNP